jgi:glutaminyl-peptide cyclotransferase
VRIVLFVIMLLFVSPVVYHPLQTSYTPAFDGTRAYNYLTAQCDFGPRPPGSENLSLCRQYIVNAFKEQGWNVTLQNFTYKETECANIIATWSGQNSSFFVIGAHYDTRPKADQEASAENRTRPILGANDGASGVAALLELASTLPIDVRISVELVCFDGEDSGDINGWNWIVGSTYFVDQLSQSAVGSITGMILLDMIGDANLVIPRESTSTRSLQDNIWQTAESMGDQNVFVDSSGWSVIDDHSPFLDAGIPAVDLIQTPFPWYWHTLEDTPDKCSAASLQVVGQVVETFIVTAAGSGITFQSNLPVDYTMVILIAVPVILVVSYWLYRRR